MHRSMRRANREITDADELLGIIEACDVVRVGAVDEEGLFIVPMSFGFDWKASGEEGRPRLTVWLHSAREGRKADAWSADPRVAIELDCPDGVITGDYACSYSLAYRSIMGSGRISQVKDAAEKLHGLARIMEHAAPGSPTDFSPEAVEHVAVWRIDVERLTGKSRRA